MLKIRQSAAWLALAGLLISGTCAAGSDIPNLVGTWTVQSEGGVLALPGGPRANIHHQGEFSTFTGEAVVTKQEGRIVHGVISSPRAKERFIGAISMDNKHFYVADEDGTLEGEIVDNDKLYTAYHHVTPTDTVIGIGIWTRKQ